MPTQLVNSRLNKSALPYCVSNNNEMGNILLFDRSSITGAAEPTDDTEALAVKNLRASAFVCGGAFFGIRPSTEMPKMSQTQPPLCPVRA
jgi:hypothetical protein